MTEQELDALSIKEIVLEIRDDVKAINARLDATNSRVEILNSQHLDDRVSGLEAWRNRIDGRMTMLTVGVGVAVGLVSVFTLVVGLIGDFVR